MVRVSLTSVDDTRYLDRAPTILAASILAEAVETKIRQTTWFVALESAKRCVKESQGGITLMRL